MGLLPFDWLDRKVNSNVFYISFNHTSLTWNKKQTNMFFQTSLTPSSLQLMWVTGCIWHWWMTENSPEICFNAISCFAHLFSEGAPPSLRPANIVPSEAADSLCDCIHFPPPSLQRDWVDLKVTQSLQSFASISSQFPPIPPTAKTLLKKQVFWRADPSALNKSSPLLGTPTWSMPSRHQRSEA